MFSALDLRSIATSGGGLTLDASDFSALDLRSIATAGKPSNSALVLKNCQVLTALDLRSIASSSPGNVHFEFFG